MILMLQSSIARPRGTVEPEDSADPKKTSLTRSVTLKQLHHMMNENYYSRPGDPMPTSPASRSKKKSTKAQISTTHIRTIKQRMRITPEQDIVYSVLDQSQMNNGKYKHALSNALLPAERRLRRQNEKIIKMYTNQRLATTRL